MTRQALIAVRLVVAAGVGLASAPVSGAVVYKDVGALVAEARQIIIGDVAEVTSFWDDGHGLIKSRITIIVDQYLVGDGPGLEVLEMSGGTVGDLTLVVSVLPTFRVGDRVLLFLGDSPIRLVQSFQGAYLTDGKDVVRMGGGCTRVIPESRQPLADLLREIQAALPSGTVLRELKPQDHSFQLPIGERYSLCGWSWAYQANPMGESHKINANCVDSSAGDPNSQRTQIENGADAWTNAGAEYMFIYGGTSTLTNVVYDNTNLVYFDTTPPDGGGYVAATYLWYNGANMIENDLVFNDKDYTWWNGSGSCSGMMDIWNISAHEFGHWLCLLDLYGGGDSQKTMYGYVNYCETLKRTLHSDDIAGILAIYGAKDTTPPTPNPMYFEITPYGASTTSIAMKATTATDSQNPPVWYEFEFVGGGSGGTSSGWQSSRDYTDTGLTVNTQYTYRCRARDSANWPNSTQFSANASAYTLANVPAAPTLSNVTSTTMQLDVNPGGNPAATEFAVRCAATSDPTWSGKYVNATGNPSGSAVWQTDAAWGNITILSLKPGTQYCFDVKARNGDLVETTFSTQACATTSAGGVNPGDMNCDGAVNFDDINPFVLALSDPQAWQQQYPGCNILNGDFTGDGQVTFDDINGFVNCLAGGGC